MQYKTFAHRDEWLKWRRGKIGASAAPAVMGVSPWQTRSQVYEELCGRGKPVFYTRAMQRGHDLEGSMVAIARDYLGVDLVEQACFESPLIDRIIATCDAVGVVAGEVVVVEVKVRQSAVVAKSRKEGRPPLEVRMQMIQQMHCAGATRGVCVMCDGLGEVAVLDVLWDEALWRELLAQELDMLGCVDEGRDPTHYIYREYTTMDQFEELCKKYIALQPSAEELLRQEQLKEVEEALKGLAAEQKKCVEGKWMRVEYSEAKGAVDYAKVPQLKGVDLEPYRKPAVGRTKIVLDKAGLIVAQAG